MNELSMGKKIAFVVLLLVGLGYPTALVAMDIGSAKARLVRVDANIQNTQEQVAVAQEADEQYCTPELRQILRRVLASCGLLGGSGRGCQPMEAKNVATMSGEDFNALFLPMKGHGGIVQFDRDKSELDANDLALVDRLFADRRGASYFFTVARTSPEGAVEHNRELSRARAESVMNHLRQTFQDPELERQVGLLWLGEEFAQLDQSFCEWNRSGETETCSQNELNRSAFVAWIDCRL